MKLKDSYEYNTPSLDEYYTWKIVNNNGVDYEVLDNTKATELFETDWHYLLGKKTEPTKIRKAIPWEVIATYVKNADWEYVPEWEGVTAKEGDYVFQNVNDAMDTYIPTNFDMSEYEAVNEWDNYTEEFQLFMRKSEPSKILPGIIEKPTLLIVKNWGDYEQFLDVWATLKSEWSEVTWINKGWFEAWSIVDENGKAVESQTKKVKGNLDEILPS